MNRIINKLIVNKKSFNKAFTLVELMVVISIFLLITGVTIFNYGSFRSNVSLQNLTDDIAMSIRKAQSFAVGTRVNSGSFASSYGVHFSADSGTDALKEGNNKSFLMFAVPTSEEKKYEYKGSDPCGNSSNECKELLKINTADYIKGFGIDQSTLNKDKGYLDITFTRPNLRASFCYRPDLSSPCVSASMVTITVSNGELDSSKEKKKVISIENSGQISIK